MTTELDIAWAVATGVASSPQRLPGFSLFALRFSGTGTAWREAHQEHVFRPPEQYLTPEMCARIAGVPVVSLHPENGHLNSETYAQTVIGAIAFGYIASADGVQSEEGDELWCIARINDSDAADAMATGKLSTSPAVIFLPDSGNETIELDDDTHILCESKPAIIDHLAACIDFGVWDRGGPAAGIRTDSETKEPTMDDDEKKAAEAAAAKVKADAEEKERADAEAPPAWAKSFMDAVSKRLDAVEKKDSTDASGNVFPDSDEKPKPGPAKNVFADAKARRDAEAKDETAKADAQERADSVASAFGESAPRPLSGETTIAYRARLAGRFQKHCKDFADIKLSAIADAQLFNSIEGRIYADAMSAASRGPEVAPGQLREVVKVDRATGRRTTEFYGDPELCWGEFKSPARRGRINTGLWTPKA